MTNSCWSNPVDQYEVETALDAGRLYLSMVNGNWYQLRRNGRTKTWKRNPERFYIPVKWGMYGYGVIDEAMPKSNLRIADSRVAAETKVVTDVSGHSERNDQPISDR
jgi:hypothetical protein